MTNRYLGGGVLVGTGVLLIVKLWGMRDKLTNVYRENKLPFLAGGYCLLVIVASCILNFDWEKQHKWPMSAILMLSAFSSYVFLLISYWLFKLSPNHRYLLLAIFLFFLMNGLAFWQLIDYEGTRTISNYFLKGDYFKKAKTSSFFVNKTEYGAIAATISLIFAILLVYKKRTAQQNKS